MRTVSVPPIPMGRASAKPEVIIYSRPGCHLCDEAKLVILSAGCSDEFTLGEVNIESDPELLRRYRNDIPVITIDGAEAFKHAVNADAFRDRLRSTDKSKLGG